MPHPDLRSFLSELRKRKDLLEINVEVDPFLEAAEIHRRVIHAGGPALLFNRMRGSSIRVVTNLFGTEERTHLAFGSRGLEFVRDAVSLIDELVPFSPEKLWEKRGFFKQLLNLGKATTSDAPVAEVAQVPPRLSSLPLLTTWSKDGGPFFTLPLVYTEHPHTQVENLGMYRMQRYDDEYTGMHMQIGKGGGFHLSVAREDGRPLPLNVFLGGPPAMIMSAIAPLPENVSEFMLAALLLGKKIPMAKNPYGPLPLLAQAEFVLVGSVDPVAVRPEGPFGDHYGYYSLTHDFPVFQCKAMLSRKDAILPATVVGKPRQEDFFIGDYLQELLAPVISRVMPTVKNLWSYGETGYHSLAAAVVRERYKREALVSAFRILGEGQLSLTKFLLLVDREQNLKDFRALLEFILERADFRTDLYVFSHSAMDTLDYTGPALHQGSKGVLIGMGEPIRTLPASFHGTVPVGVHVVKPFCRGCLVVSGPPYNTDREFSRRIAEEPTFLEWPLIVVSDDAARCASSPEEFLWSTFTRFEPAADIHGRRMSVERFHISLEAPIVVDARMKPHYPDELQCDEETARLVDRRWREYFPGQVTGSFGA